MVTIWRTSRFILVSLLALVFASCGGGGGGDNSAAPAPAPAANPAPASATTYTAAATVGELLTYTADLASRTYSYRIVDSQFGLAGRTGSGTLALNSDGTYTPSGAPNARLIFLPNGLMIGAVRESISGVTRNIPIIGTSNPVTSLNVAQGTYNFVQRSCVPAGCFTDYGTFTAKQQVSGYHAQGLTPEEHALPTARVHLILSATAGGKSWRAQQRLALPSFLRAVASAW